MGFFAKPKHCVFSAISGTITLNGEPVKHARLVRTGKLGHAKTDVVDETTTDENGYFSLPNMFQSASEAGGLAMFIIFQQITVEHEGAIHRIWSGNKMDSGVNTEGRGKPLNITCELINEDEVKNVQGNSFITKCDLGVELDVIEDQSNNLFG